MSVKNTFLVFLAILVLRPVTAQSGLLPEDPAALDTMQRADFQPARQRTGAGFPENYSLLDALGQPPETTENCLACAGGAIAQAFALHHATRTAICEGKAEWVEFSASFVYNQIKQGKDCDAGARLSDGLKLLASQGICPAADFPNSRYACSRLPDARQLEIAKRFKIKGFQRLFEPSQLKEAPQIVIETLKNALQMSNPIVAALQVTEEFLALPPGVAVWQPGEGRSEKTSLHAFVLTGYDEVHFEVLGCQRNQWAKGGRVKIRCDDLVKMLASAYLMTPLPCGD